MNCKQKRGNSWLAVTTSEERNTPHLHNEHLCYGGLVRAGSGIQFSEIVVTFSPEANIEMPLKITDP